MKAATHRLLLPVVLAGCAAHGYSFRTDRGSYRAGDAIDVLLENHSDRDVGYNLCGVVLERRDRERWVPEDYWVPVVRRPGAPPSRELSSSVCLANLATLRPWGRTGTTVGLNDGAAAGEYRLRTRIEWERRVILWLIHFGAWGKSQEIVTARFTVLPRGY